MGRQFSEPEVARLLAGLGVAVFMGLLPVPWVDVVVAAGLVAIGLGIVLTRPRGNRVLGFGIAALGSILAVAAWRLDDAPAIHRTLTVFVAAILLVATYLKQQGKW